jgi:hypothetical protein
MRQLALSSADPVQAATCVNSACNRSMPRLWSFGKEQQIYASAAKLSLKVLHLVNEKENFVWCSLHGTLGLKSTDKDS